MRIVFMGTPDFAVPTLDSLVAAGHEVAAVYSQPPRPAGRGKGLRKGAVHARADALRIPVRTPLSLRDPEEQAAFAALGCEAAVVAAYGLILPPAILAAPRLGCLNVHASLLPRWRGASPVQRAILAGDAVTGVTIMQMDRGLDTGAMLAKVETPVDGKTAGELTDELAVLGAKLLVGTLEDMPPAIPQRDGATYAAKLDKAEARLDFAAAAEQVERQIRAFHPTAFFEIAGERIRILEAYPRPGAAEDPAAFATEEAGSRLAPGHVIDGQLTIACGTGAIRPTLIQRAGKSVMAPAELLRGFAIPPGTILA